MLLVLAACVHDITMHSRTGARIQGHYRFARENTGMIQVTFPGDEVVSGKFITISRAAFVDAYAKTDRKSVV